MDEILILEDNQDCIEIYQNMLGEKYKIDFALKLSELKSKLSDPKNYKCLIADLHLPDGHFLNWFSSLDNWTKNFPIFVVSSEEDIEILRHAFELGIEDYFTKPFKKNELLVKLERVLKKNRNLQETKDLDPFFDGLTLIENKIFSVLLNNLEKTISRDDLQQTVWKKVQVSPKTLDVHLSNLRKKIIGSKWLIESDDNGWKARTNK